MWPKPYFVKSLMLCILVFCQKGRGKGARASLALAILLNMSTTLHMSNFRLTSITYVYPGFFHDFVPYIVIFSDLEIKTITNSCFVLSKLFVIVFSWMLQIVKVLHNSNNYQRLTLWPSVFKNALKYSTVQKKILKIIIIS